jgi:hypothetical protein
MAGSPIALHGIYLADQYKPGEKWRVFTTATVEKPSWEAAIGLVLELPPVIIWIHIKVQSGS